MEEMLGNVNGAREIFRRWMRWMPEPRGWNTFINFEVRRGGGGDCLRCRQGGGCVFVGDVLSWI